jgi:hypothetical protein
MRSVTSDMALYAVTSEVASKPPRGVEAITRHGRRIEGLLREARIRAHWIECRTSWIGSGVVDVIDAPDDETARAAADLIALAHASASDAA